MARKDSWDLSVLLSHKEVYLKGVVFLGEEQSREGGRWEVFSVGGCSGLLGSLLAAEGMISS